MSDDSLSGQSSPGRKVFSKKGLLDALDALSEELGRRNVRADLFVIGGGAVALAFDARRTTRDIDAIFEPEAEVYKAALAVAYGKGLNEDWLNDAAKGFMPGTDTDATTIYETEWLQVAVGSPEYLLAMKLLSSRIDRDTDDIRLLCKLCGFTQAEEALALLARFYPTFAVPLRTQHLVEEILAEPEAG